MSDITNLQKAKNDKKDEFYTQLKDIENELKYYEYYFKDKIVYCNCDNPEWSNFWKYFEMNFEYLGLKKVIATHYEKNQPTYKLELTKNVNSEGVISIKSVKTPLMENGDFRSQECIEILKEADIVVTNPPFSLFRKYVAQLIEYNKKFIIIGNQNAITYRDIFPLIKNNKLWLGVSINGNTEFRIPDDYPLRASKFRVDDKGQKFISVKGVRWFTNLDHKKRNEELILYKTYTEEEYHKYDNYDAINVNKTKEIPVDYDGVMGVPITFLDKYNHEQFEIIGLGNSRNNFTPNKNYINPKKVLKNGKIVNGGAINCVLAIEVEQIPVNQVYYISDNSQYLIAPYARILIKKKR